MQGGEGVAWIFLAPAAPTRPIPRGSAPSTPPGAPPLNPGGDCVPCTPRGAPPQHPAGAPPRTPIGLNGLVLKRRTG
ncbi:hypothetical protein GCM10022403_089380 [Streptomyces coacervatus]|uniref:Uncharacterized protein n=1 Tax=Streptomyces coacervatus TaxID=647381 RepID=A0ABP7JFV1_9ACTN